jgi:hypothetical protein
MRYFWLRNAQRHPVACVATLKALDSKSVESIVCGVASWNPLDRFDRDRARSIASSRLGLNPFAVVHINNDNTVVIGAVKGRLEASVPPRQVKHTICFLIAHYGASQATRDAAKLWLAEYDRRTAAAIAIAKEALTGEKAVVNG